MRQPQIAETRRPLLRGIAIGGRMGSGKNFVINVLLAAIPHSTSIEISQIIQHFLEEQHLVGIGERDVEKMQAYGQDERFNWAQQAEQLCNNARSEGMIPLLSACRRAPEEQAAQRLGYPMIVIVAPRELRIQRISDRDHLTFAAIKRIVDNPDTETFTDELRADVTFNNTGSHTLREFGKLFAFLDGIR